LKKTVTLLFANAFLVGLLTGCSSPNAIVAGTTISIGELGSISNLNTDIASDSVGQSLNAELANLTTASFYVADANGQLVANESFGTVKLVSKSPFTVEYSLTENAKWSDGQTVDASDLLLSWAAASDNTKAGFHSSRASGGLNQSTGLPKVTSDQKSIRVTYDSAVADWKTALTVPVAAHLVGQVAFKSENLDSTAAKARVLKAIQTSSAADLRSLASAYRSAFKISASAPESAQVSAGAYRFEKSLGSNGIQLRANPNFTWGATPKVETVLIKLYFDSAAQLEALSSGDIDIASPSENAGFKNLDIANALAAMKSSGVDYKIVSSSAIEQIVLNFGEKSFFSSNNFNGDTLKPTALKDAFLKMVPRSKILAAASSELSVRQADSFVYPSNSNYYTAVTQANGSASFRFQEAELAREIVRDTKPKDGRYSVRVLFDSSNPQAQIEFGLLDERASIVGFKLENISTSDIAPLIKSGEYDVLITDAPLLGLQDAGSSNLLSSNATGVVDKVTLDLFSSAVAQSDAFKQAEIFQKLDTALFSTHFGLPLYQVPSIVAYNTRISGFTPAPFGRSATWGYWTWSVAAPDSGK
jgi:peptide/nickel transport system substrate-binding protein